MTKFNTGNPVGSSDPRDLFDNAAVADSLVTGEAPAYSDRLGKSRKSWQGMEDEFAAFIAASGYEFVGDYAAGIEINGYNQVVRDTGGEFWRVSGSTNLPYTTTGSGLPEGDAFVSVGDAALRQELAASTVGQGSDLIAHTGTTDTVREALNKRTIYVGSVAELADITPQTDGAHYEVAGYHPGSGIGGGTFYWDASRNKADHTGGSIIDPGKSYPLDWSITGDVAAFFTADGVGAGCYVRIYRQKTMLEDYGMFSGLESMSSTNKIIIENAKQHEKRLYGTPGKTYWFAPETQLGIASCSYYGQWSTLKQVGGTQDLNWLLLEQAPGVKFKGFSLDGNRVNTPNFSTDRSLLTIYNTSDVDAGNLIVFASQAKGVAVTSGASGAGTKHIRLNTITAYDCFRQCLTIDGTGTPECTDVTISKVFVKDTDHAAITAGDGAKRITISDCVLDPNNATWDALGLRGGQGIHVSNVIGRRARYGCSITRLAGDALCKDITMSGNTWEFNQQHGVLITAGKSINIFGDIARNNGQSGAGFSGFIVTQVVGLGRSENVTLSAVQAYDDQVTATQGNAITIDSSDNVTVSAPQMHGNTIRNRVWLNDVNGLSEISVTGDGADGAVHKIKSQTTGVVPASSRATVTVNFDTPFDVSPNWANAAVSFGSATAYLRVQKILALTTSAIQVDVRNDTGTDATGVVYVEARYLS